MEVIIPPEMRASFFDGDVHPLKPIANAMIYQGVKGRMHNSSSDSKRIFFIISVSRRTIHLSIPQVNEETIVNDNFR